MLIFLIFLMVASVKCKFIIGPAEITVLRIADCPGLENLEINLQMYMHKLNRTKQVFDMNLTLPFDIDGHTSMELSASKWGDGGWKKNAFGIKENKICETLNLLMGKMWFEMQEKFQMTPKQCPIKQGFYNGTDIELDLTKMRIQTFWYGKFQSELHFKRYNRLVLCKQFEVELSDKKLRP